MNMCPWQLPKIPRSNPWLKGLMVFSILTAGAWLPAQTPPAVSPASAKAALERADYPEALRQWQALARQGDGTALAFVALMNKFGWGATVNSLTMAKTAQLAMEYGGGPGFAAVLELVRPLAAKGEAHAQGILGFMTLWGYGMPKDPKDGMKWLRLSADQGNDSAQFALGAISEDGVAGSKDLDEALKWYRLAAAQGNALALHNLGNMYREGNGVRKDFAEALRWYRLSAEKGDPKGTYQIGYMYANKQGVPLDLGEALKWYSASAGQGDPASQIHVGEGFRDGKGVQKDPVEACRWFCLATYYGRLLSRREYFNYALDEFQKASKRITSSQRNQVLLALARACRDGNGLPKDEVAGYTFFQLSAREESDPASRDSCLKEKDELGKNLTPFEITRSEARAGKWPRL